MNEFLDEVAEPLGCILWLLFFWLLFSGVLTALANYIIRVLGG